jgi:hypothetical protein
MLNATSSRVSSFYSSPGYVVLSQEATLLHYTLLEVSPRKVLYYTSGLHMLMCIDLATPEIGPQGSVRVEFTSILASL